MFHLFEGYTSLVIISGFIGIESLTMSNEEGKEDIQEALRDILKDIVRLSVTDPLVLALKGKVVDWGLNKRHREYSRNNHLIRNFIEKHIKKIRQEIKDGKEKKPGQPENMVEAILRENEKEDSEGRYTDKQLID